MNKKLLFGMVLILLFSFSLASAALDDASIYWSFDDTNLSGSNPVDISGNGNTPTNGGAATGSTGLIGQAFDFEDADSDYLDISSYTLASGTDRSISVWINPESLTDEAFIWDSQTGRWILALQDSPVTNGLAWFDGAWKNSGTQASTGSWQHVVYVFKGSQAWIYLDNTVILNTSYTQKAIGGVTYVGARYSLASSGYDGLMDEFGLWERALTPAEVSELYNSGNGFNPYAPLSAYTTNVTNIYLSPNTSVYTDESDLRGYVTLNETTGVSGINYTYTVNGADITTDQYTGSPSGSTYTLPVFSNTNFAQNDNVTVKAFAVNSTGGQISAETTSSQVTIDNRVPTSSLSWTTTSPLNDSNFSGIVTPGDGDQDNINISWDLFKNGVLSTSGTSNNNAYPYGDITLFTVDEATTNIGDNYSFNVSIFDGFEYHVSGQSVNATVVDTSNFTITVTDEWSGLPITDYAFVINSSGLNITPSPSSVSTSFCSSFGDACYSYTVSDKIVFNEDGQVIDDAYIDGSNLYVARFSNVNLTNQYYTVNVNGSLGYLLKSGLSATTPSIYYINTATAYGYSNESTFITSLVSNSTANVEIYSYDYFPRTYSNWNLSENLAAELTPFYYAINYSISGNITYSGTNYFRSSNIYFNFICNTDGDSYINIFEGTTLFSSTTVNCNNSEVASKTITYTPTTEGSTTLKAYLNSTLNTNRYDQTFFSIPITRDVNAPTITSLNFTSDSGFSWFNISTNAICTDSISPYLTYNVSFNNVNQFYSNESSGYNYQGDLQPEYGTNTLFFICSDLFSSDNETYSSSVYRTSIVLIDEKENDVFDVTNITGARAYFADNRSFFDFKSNSTSAVNFTGIDESQIRFEFIYSGGTVINRWVDVSLLGQEDLRVCVFKDDNIQAYQQLIASTSQQPVGVKNVFSDCYVGLDYTRFAYQNNQILNVYTINALYYLYTYNDGQLVYLASIDGSQESSINLDVLEFADKTYNIDLLSPSLSVKKYSNQTLLILYNDDRTGIQSATLNIVNLDSDVTVFSTTLDDPNSFTLYYDYSTLNYTNNTLFKAVVTTELSSGAESDTSVFFNLKGQTGRMTSQLALAFALLLTVFGLTFTRPSLSLSWLGLFIIIGSIIISGMAIPTMALNLLIGIDIVIMLFILVTMFSGSTETEVLR